MEYVRVCWTMIKMSEQKDLMSPLMFKIVVGALLLGQALTCSTSYDLDQSVCTFYMTYTDAQCYSFTFTQCILRTNQKNTTYTVWSDCIYKCCVMSDNLPTNLESIYTCQDSIYSYYKRFTIIIVVTIGGSLFIVFVVILSSRRCCFFRAFSQLNQFINRFILRWVERKSRARPNPVRHMNPTQEQIVLFN